MVKGFQFGPVRCCQYPAFVSPERNIDDSCLIEPATDIERGLIVAE
jgi:hypothetical protein